MIYKFLVQLLTFSNAMVAGTFFAFSVYMMTALASIDAEHGAKAMNSINATIVRSPWLALFLLSALLSLVLPLYAWYTQGFQKALPLIVSGASYLLGTFLVTMLCNVPLNDKLASLHGKELLEFWPQYVKGWNPWNHVRTVCSILSTIALFGSSRIG
jgi:uncharacterized membrane protein